ncbi:MarR family transcriptional regulator [Neorhizobium sp. SOG26]|jgi:Transcriptional regulators|uniref:MarR family transcriptional regulator n=1 Tax=Neorhizobium turbinariae TaxID=2937795 RepID=A0ABT0IVM6_9HYPH|nr:MULTISPECIES: MarR family transcriptional regulator [Neorhizobium]AXV16946.1 MarR family transcriptional regulator [Neorhizobium sp. SOG26]MCK8781928.1 MarR family transcriptional regulator [Neorhizobium turbinariae]
MDMPVRVADDVDLGRLDSALGFLLRMAQLKVYERFFETLGDKDLKPGEFSVLWVISRNPGIRQSVLGQRLMIKRAHMTKLIRGFEDRGLVTRRVPDEDRRAVEITLTPEAAARVEKAAEWFFDFEDAVGNNLSSAEQKQLTLLLRKIVGLN